MLKTVKVLGIAFAIAAICSGILFIRDNKANAAICNTQVPLGAIAPATPEWCFSHVPGIDTHVESANAWSDDFNHGQTHATLNDSYTQFNGVGVVDSIQFQHNNHWMVDVQTGPETLGGALTRPNRSFTFENGKLVIEADAAAGISAYDIDAWPELDVSLAPAPTGKIVDILYAYGRFGGAYTFGCRLQSERTPVCALYQPNGVRVWEMSWFQEVTSYVYGGYPFDATLSNAWNVCKGTDPDTYCRDHFRLELTQTSVKLFVNGTLYFEQSGTKNLFPDVFVNSPVYTYFSSWTYRPNQVVRFHWDHVAVNPDSLGSSATPTPTSTVPTSTPTSTPTLTPTSTPTPTAKTYRCQVQNSNGSWSTVWKKSGGGSCP